MKNFCLINKVTALPAMTNQVLCRNTKSPGTHGFPERFHFRCLSALMEETPVYL